MKNYQTRKIIKKLWAADLLPIVLIVVSVAFGSFLRLQGIVTNSFAFTYDVGRDMLALSNILHTHRIPLIGFTTGLPGVFYGPWWYIFLLIPYILVNGNPQGIAVFMALTGVCTIITTFFLGYIAGGKKLGVVLALLISFSPSLIGISSQIWNPNIAPLFVSLVYLLLFIEYKSDSSSWVTSIILGLLLGFLFDSEIVFGTLFFIGIIISLLLFLRKKIHILQVLSFMGGIFVIFSPRILFELRHKFLMSESIVAAFTHGTPHAGELTSQFVSRSIFFINLWADSLSGHNFFIAILMIVFTLVTSVIFYQRIARITQMILLTQWVIIGVFLLGLTLFSHDIWPHYTVGLPIVYIVLFGLCLSFWIKTKQGRFLSIILVFLLFWINVLPFQLISAVQKPLFIGDASVYRNQLQVIDYVYQQAHYAKFKYIVYTPPVYDYTYQYLFQWYGRKKYGYVPEKNHAGLFFVIMEPDTQYPSRLRDWLAARKQDGVIEKTVTMPSGIVVQTRSVNE